MELLLARSLNFDEIFLQVLDLSAAGSVVILAVLGIRLLLKKAPRICAYVLWIAVLLRLLCPFAPAAPWAVIEDANIGASYSLANADIDFTGAAVSAYRAVGDAVNGGLGIQHIPTTQSDSQGPHYVTSDWYDVWILFGKYVWLAGVVFLLIRAGIDAGKLRKILRFSAPLGQPHWSDDVVVPQKPWEFLTDGLHTAFVVGLFRPKIYLPSNLSPQEQEFMLLHERHHIKRGDHIWKLLGFLALCIHWFNPLVHLAFRLACKDMEMSCDEAVLQHMGTDIRRDYAASLLRVSTGAAKPSMPLAFGEDDTTDRIHHVMKHRATASWLTAVILVPVLLAAGFLMTNRSAVQTEIQASVYVASDLYSTPDSVGNALLYCVTPEMELYGKSYDREPWNKLGALEPYPLTNSELLEYAPWEQGWKRSYRIKTITDAHILRTTENMFYLLLRTNNGHTLLGYGWEDVGERGQGASDDTHLQWLCTLSPREDFGTVSGLTLTSLLDGAYLQLGTQQIGDFYITAFRSGEYYRDLGFAVFHQDEGYRLVDWHLYEHASLTEGGIYCCPDPAVLSDQGIMTNKNTYDVVLNCNPQLDHIVRTVTVEGTIVKTIERSNLTETGLILFQWAEQDVGKPQTVSQKFYDSNGNQIILP